MKNSMGNKTEKNHKKWLSKWEKLVLQVPEYLNEKTDDDQLNEIIEKSKLEIFGRFVSNEELEILPKEY